MAKHWMDSDEFIDKQFAARNKEISELKAQLAEAERDTARIEFLERWMRRASERGFAWDGYTIRTDSTVRSQIDAAMRTADSAPAARPQCHHGNGLDRRLHSPCGCVLNADGTISAPAVPDLMQKHCPSCGQPSGKGVDLFAYMAELVTKHPTAKGMLDLAVARAAAGSAPAVPGTMPLVIDDLDSGGREKLAAKGLTLGSASAPLKDAPAPLREYLRVYGGHIHPCPGRPCECGFQKAWEVAGLPTTTPTVAEGAKP